MRTPSATGAVRSLQGNLEKMDPSWAGRMDESTPQPRRIGRWLREGFQVLFTLFLLGLAFRKVPLDELGKAFLELHPWMGAGAILLFGVLLIPLEAARFRSAGHVYREKDPPWRGWVFLYLESRKFQYLLPASMGAEGVLWYRLKQRGWRHATCGFVVFATRGWGMVGWAFTAAVALAWAPGVPAILAGLAPWMIGPWPWGTGALLGTLVLGLGPLGWARWKKLPLSPEWRRHLLAQVGFMALTLVANGLSAWLAARSAGLSIPLLSILGLLALVNFAIALPASVGGLGIQEWLVLRLGSELGLAAAPLLVFSMLLHAQRLGLTVAGAFVSHGFRKREVRGDA